MPKIITFSRTYPSYHPRAGEPTKFIEKILKSLYPGTSYYPVACENCGWISMSCCALGGNAIADTGDYDDPYCPKCGSIDIDGDIGVLSEVDQYWDTNEDIKPKYHTIRAGHRFKVGDKFSPRVWSGKPYRSKMIQFAPDIEVKKVWDIEFDVNGIASLALPGQQLKYLDDGVEELIASNDGLEYDDFCEWLIMPNYRKEKESGPMQIICWNENVNY